MAALYKASLVALAGIGAYTLHALSSQNGMYEMIKSVGERHLLTDGVTAWPQWLQDYEFRLVAPLLGFFWPFANAEQADLLLCGIPFAGAVMSGWTVILLEANRNGVRGGAGSYTTIYGLLVQTLGFAVVSPLFLLINLFSSTIPSSPTPTSLSHPNLKQLKALPYALTLGFVVPSAIMLLPYPSLLSLDSKIAAVLAWQVFPVFVTLSSYVLAPCFAGPKNASPAAQLPSLRRAYAFALLVSSIAHVYTVGLSVTSALVPSLFNEASAATLAPSNVFLPVLHAPRVVSVAEGALRLLKWDHAVGALAHVVWAVATTRNVNLRSSAFSSGSVWIDMVVRSVFLGPMSAVLCLIWERDEVVLGGEHLKTK
ncbi:hypothetical protein EJ05DRAFT_368626 [Pseudovirgaria hyperparasitica]|uniref:AtmA protein n=1 Tax=Pseudovirgaria hyperparasitica TaxID=470096 RepID=A0A6A6W756_9PEZI|nr:uncharacterized protein EJ05DRAFT_368626 [Pseudovirgaria hyperparasitica]KAF2757854.1 hypothetical protein EJ05DRAFT_368626 [Pseudovirgaria hyperparasitica]